MKFLVAWTARGGGSAADIERDTRRSLDVFAKWTPPADQTFHAFLQRLDGNGGFALIETDNPAGLLDSSSKFGAWFQFEVTPVMDIGDAVPVFNQAVEWLDSTG